MLNIDLNWKRASFFLMLIPMLGGCASLHGTTASNPVRPVQLQAANSGPSSVYWTYLNGIQSRSPEDRDKFVRQFESSVLLPIIVQAEILEFLWIIPNCSGLESSNKGRARQVPKTGPISIKCPN